MFFNSCSDNVFLISKDNPEKRLALTEAEKAILRYLDDNFTFLETEARKHALDIASNFDQVDGQKRTIGELITIHLPLNSDTSGKYIKTDSTPELYIFNFKPSGFAIIAADERSLGHVASSATSTIDSNIHPGYRIMLQGAISSVLNDRDKFKQEQDSVMKMQVYKTLLQKINHFYSEQEKQKETQTLFTWLNRLFHQTGFGGFVAHASPPPKSTLSSSYVLRYTETRSSSSEVRHDNSDIVLLRTNFHQQGPYNLRLERANVLATAHGEILLGECTTNNGYARTGCVATAYAQLLLYYNTTATQNKVSNLQTLRDHHYLGSNDLFAWGNYSNISLDVIASNLHKEILDKFLWIPDCRLIQNTIALDISGGGIINSEWGFHNGEYRSYNYSDVLNSIRNNKPVIIRSFSKECILCYLNPVLGIARLFGTIIPDPSSGHVWVIDGVRQDRVRYQVTASVYGIYEVYSFGGTEATERTETLRSSYTYFEDKIVVPSDELHHNWGWHESIKLNTYSTSNWIKSGVFQSNSIPKNYNICPDVIVNITPR